MPNPRFPAVVDEEHRLVPVHRERTKRLRPGREVWVSVHDEPALIQRSGQANKYLWKVVYGTIAKETGNDPNSVHYGLKRLAVEVGILDPQFWFLGDRMMDDEPTTVVDTDQFWQYVNWIRHEAEHGTLLGSTERPVFLHIPEPNEHVDVPPPRGSQNPISTDASRCEE